MTRMSKQSGAGSGLGEAAFLEIRDAEGHERSVRLEKPPVVIGRAAEAQVRLESSAVSRQHAQLLIDPNGRWVVRDMGSRNGTLVNGQPITEHVLAAGDRIELGGFHLMLLLPGAPPPPVMTWPGMGMTSIRTGVLVSDLAAGHLSTLKELEPPKVAAAHLVTLNELSKQLMLMDDPPRRALTFCRMMVSPPFHGQWAMLLRLSRENPELPPQPLAEPQSGEMFRTPGQSPYVSRTLLRAVTQSGEPVLAGNVPIPGGGLPGNIEMSISPQVMALAAIACPLRQDDEHLDLLYITLPPQYGTGEWLALSSLAAKQYQQAEAAWDARKRAEKHAVLQHELERATAIQLRLVPQKKALDKHRALGLDMAIGFVPSQWVGGDYADALAMKDGRVLLVVADVCGHGLAAALVAASVHTLVHACVRAGLSLADLAQSLNEHLCETLPSDAFVTMVAVALDPRTGTIESVNAGHPAPLVIGPGDEIRHLPSGENPPLGMDCVPIEGRTDQLAQGQVLLLYTDGLTEQQDDLGEMLCIEGLESEMRHIRRKQAASADAVAALLSAMLDQRQGQRPPDDDRTFLVAWRV